MAFDLKNSVPYVESKDGKVFQKSTFDLANSIPYEPDKEKEFFLVTHEPSFKEKVGRAVRGGLEKVGLAPNRIERITRARMQVIDAERLAKEKNMDLNAAFRQVQTRYESDPVGALQVFAETMKRTPESVGIAVLKAHQGAEGASVTDRGWITRTLRDAQENSAAFARQVFAKHQEKAVLPGVPIKISDVGQLAENLAFSIVSMGSALAVGAPIFVAPVPGARVAAWVTGSAVSGKAAFEMATYEIMQEYLEIKNIESIENTGAGITPKQEKVLKKGFDDKAREFGLWEAIPEAVSNLAFGALIAAPLKAMGLGKTVASQIVSKMVGLYGEEMITEAITEVGQTKIRREAGLEEGDPDITFLEALKRIAPQTFLLTTVMAGVGASAVKTKQAIQRSLKRELTEDHPRLQELTEDLGRIKSFETALTNLGLKEQEEAPKAAPEVAPEVKPEGKEKTLYHVTEFAETELDLTKETYFFSSRAEAEKLLSTPAYKDKGKIFEVTVPVDQITKVGENAYIYKPVKPETKAKAEPGTVFHGTTTGIEEARPAHLLGKLNQLLGLHVAEDIEVAKKFAGKEGKVHEFDKPKNPHIIEQKENEFDETAISRDIIENSMLSDEFVRWITNRTNKNINADTALEIFNKLKNGEVITKEEYGEVLAASATSVGDYVANFDSQLVHANPKDFKNIIERYKADLISKGHDSIQYQNTAPSETAGIENKTSYILLTKPVPKKAKGEVKAKPEAKAKAEKVAPEAVAEPTEKKVRGLAKGVEEKAIANKLTESLGELPEYETINMEEQANKANALLKKDPAKAKRIAMGKEVPPANILPESVFIAVENKAIEEGNVEVLRDLATSSSLTTEATTMGQRIRALAERDPESPVAAIKSVAEEREKTANKRNKTKSIKKVQKETVKKIKSEIKKVSATKQTWSDFIKSLQC